MHYDTSVWRKTIARKKQEQEEKRCDYLSRVQEILTQYFALNLDLDIFDRFLIEEKLKMELN